MRVDFVELAAQELQDAIRFYELEIPGLGLRFKNEVALAVQRIAKHPEAWSVERGRVRRYVMHKFPYKLLYAISESRIVVLAVAHQHRNPDYWVERVN